MGRKEVDSFILKALEANHLQPSEPAPPRVLISRPTFDLRRLPSKPQDIRAFHGNYASNPDKAYQEFFDRLLNSPQHGTQFYRQWLDLIKVGSQLRLRLV